MAERRPAADAPPAKKAKREKVGVGVGVVVTKGRPRVANGTVSDFRILVGTKKLFAFDQVRVRKEAITDDLPVRCAIFNAHHRTHGRPHRPRPRQHPQLGRNRDSVQRRHQR